MQRASSIEESKSVKKTPSKTPAKRAKASKVSKDSDKKAEQSLIDVMQNESEQPSIPDSSLLEVPRGHKVKSGSTSRRTSFNSEASGNESDVSEVNDIDVEESWNSVLKKDIKKFIEEKKEKGESWWIELLGTKVGFDAVAKKWIRGEKAKDNLGQLPQALDELVVRLVCEIDISPGTAFEAKRIFALFESLSNVIEKEQRRKIVELIVQEDKTNLLKLVCNEENKGQWNKKKDGSMAASFNNSADRRYFWKGEFSGFATIAELLNYAIDQGSPGSVRLLVDKIYSALHPIYNKGRYLGSTLYLGHYSCSVNGKSIMSGQEKEEFFKELLEKVIEKGFTDSLLGMLGGDIAQLILRMSKDKFEACDELQDIYNMTKTAVIRVLQSLVQPQAEDRKALIKELIEKGATVEERDINEKDLIALAGEHGVKLLLKGKGKGYIKRKLQENGVNVSEVKRKLSQGVIYGIIVELFFHQHKQIYAIAEGTNKLIFYDYYKDLTDKDKVKEVLSDLKQDIEGEVLKVIIQLNKVGRAQQNLFSRLVFKEIMLVEPNKGKDSEINVDNVEKIIKACAALCQEPMQELVEGIKINKINLEIYNILRLINVELPDNITVLDTLSFNASDIIYNDFQREIGSVYNNPSSVPAFSGFSQYIIDMLEAGEEKLPEVISEVEKNVKVLDDKGSIDVNGTFQVLEILHPKITKEQRRKIVELIVQEDKTNLLKLICNEENKSRENKKKDGSMVTSSNNMAIGQYFWKGEFSGFATIVELLEYTIDQDSPGSARLLVDRIYSTLHPIYNRVQYLDNVRYLQNYRCSVNGKSVISVQEKEEFFKELLEKVIEKGFTDSLLGMLSGDIAQLILRMSKDKFEACDELQDIYNMTKTAVIDVLQSLVQPQAEDRKALIKELIEKGATVEEQDITEKDLIALVDEHKIKLPWKAGINDIKRKLQENGVNVSEVKRKLSQGVIYGIIVELFFHQHKQIYAIAEGTNKLIFHDSRNDPTDKGKVKEVLSDLKQDIEGEVLKVITKFNRVGHAQQNLFSRLVFKEIMLVEPNKGKDSEINVDNVEKIMKGCVALRKEPMQKLVDELREKGVTINEKVMDVLKLVGVDSLALEKSNVVASRNIPLLQIEDLTLSSNSGSEKSTSNELRQPSADAELTSDDCSSTSRDPLKINITGPERVAKAKVLSPPPPGSKAVEKKDKGFMQSNCGQGGESYYNADVGSSRYYLNIQNSCRMVGMHSLQQGGIDKIRSKQRESSRKKSSNVLLPKVSYLEDAHCERYREVFLNMMLDYNEFVDCRDLLQEDPNTGVGRSSLSSSSDTSLVTSPNSQNGSRDQSYEEEDHYLDGMRDYNDAIDLFKKRDVDQAKGKICQSASKKFEYGMFAYAIIKFKEAIEGNITLKNMSGVDCAPQEVIKEAVKCMLDSGKFFSPLSSFILGIMELYNPGNYGKVIQHESEMSWKRHFADVLRYTETTTLRDNLLGFIGASNLDSIQLTSYLNTVGEERGRKKLEFIVEYVEYELAKEMISNKKELVTADCLLKRLSSESFFDAKYSYAVALFSGRFGYKADEKKKEEIRVLLQDASRGCPEAKLFMGGGMSLLSPLFVGGIWKVI